MNAIRLTVTVVLAAAAVVLAEFATTAPHGGVL